LAESGKGRSPVDSGGLIIADSRAHRGELQLDLCWVPEVVGVQKGYEFAARRMQSSIAGHTRAAILLFQITNTFPEGSEHALKLLGIRRAIVDDDYFKLGK